MDTLLLNVELNIFGMHLQFESADAHQYGGCYTVAVAKVGRLITRYLAAILHFTVAAAGGKKKPSPAMNKVKNCVQMTNNIFFNVRQSLP